MYYYEKLNENRVCTEVITRATKLPQDLSGFVPLPHYTEIHLYRKWDGKQWSQETFEPIVDMQRIEQQVTELVTENETLEQTIQTQQSQIDELTLQLGDALLGGAL